MLLLCKWLNFHCLPVSVHSVLPSFLAILDTVTVQTNTKLYAAAAKSLQSCPTLCDPIDASPLGSPVPGIL